MMRPQPPGPHAGQDPLGHQEGGLQVDRQHLVPIRFGDLRQGLMADDAGIVHQDVHLAQIRFDHRHQAVHFRGQGDVGVHRHGPAAQPFDGLDGVQGLGFAAKVVHGQVGAGLGQGEGHGPADPPGGPGDQGYFTGQVVEHRYLSRMHKVLQTRRLRHQ